MTTHTMKSDKYTWNITCLPDSNAVGWSHGVVVEPEARGEGLGQKTHQQRLAFAKALGLRTLLASVEEYNTVQVHIMEKMGWKRAFQIDDCSWVWAYNLGA